MLHFNNKKNNQKLKHDDKELKQHLLKLVFRFDFPKTIY